MHFVGIRKCKTKVFKITDKRNQRYEENMDCLDYSNYHV